MARDLGSSSRGDGGVEGVSSGVSDCLSIVHGRAGVSLTADGSDRLTLGLHVSAGVRGRSCDMDRLSQQVLETGEFQMTINHCWSKGGWVCAQNG